MELKRYLALQKREVDEHKYFLSEQRGYDVGYEEAFFDWVRSPHAARFREAAEARTADLEALCAQYCGGNCKGLTECPLPLEELHDALGDGY